MRPCNPVNRFLRSLKSLTKRRVLKETNIMLSLQNLSCFPYLLTHTMLSIWLILALCYMHVQVAFHIWKFVHCNNIYLPRKRCFLSGHEHRDHTCDKRKNIFLYLFNKLTKENLLSFLFHWSVYIHLLHSCMVNYKGPVRAFQSVTNDDWPLNSQDLIANSPL